MSGPRIAAIDVGTGTQDILIFEAGTVIENSVQLVMPSPTVLLADRVKQATADRVDPLSFRGDDGGRPRALGDRGASEAGTPGLCHPDAARTFDDDLSRVEAMGVRVVDGATGAVTGARRIELRDFYFPELVGALRTFRGFDRLRCHRGAVFDHGAAPPDYSDRRFRFDYLREQVERGTGLEGFGFMAADIPERMTRMQAVASTWSGTAPLFVMDTGPAAVLGALDDPAVAAADPVMLVNVGNFHTVAFLLEGRRITGLFEHHTGELTAAELESYLERLSAGTLSNDEVFADMGHGALELGPVAIPSALIALTGPRRGLLEGSRLRPLLAVPHGAMMMAGCYGLLRALASHQPDLAGAVSVSLVHLDPS